MRFSLKFKIACATTLLAVVLVALVAGLQRMRMGEDYLALIEREQAWLTAATADALAEKIELQLQVLQQSAQELGRLDLNDPPVSQAALTSLAPARALFFGLTLVEPGGRVVGTLPSNPQAIGTNLSDREYFRIALDVGEPNISPPLRSRLSGKPMVLMAAPILGADARARGVLIGALDLNHPNTLGALRDTPIGNSGHFVVVTRGAAPVYVAHPDPSKVLQPLMPEDLMRDDDPAGRQGPAAIVTRRYLRTVNWELRAVLPQAEVLAPLTVAQERLLRDTVLLAAGFAVLVWAATFWLLRPLGRLQRAIGALRQGAALPLDAPVAEDDEIGDVARDFVALMQELQSRRAELEAVNDASPLGIFRCDAQGRILYVNDSYLRITGLTGTQAAAGEWQRLLDPADAREAVQSWNDSVQSAAGHRRVQRLHRSGDGRAVVVSVYAAPVRIGGDVAGFVGTMEDITEQRAVEAALQQSEARLRSILTHAPDAFVSINAAGDVIEWNQQAEATFGRSRDEVLGRNAAEFLIPPALHGSYASALQRVTLTGHGPAVNRRIEMPVLHRDGREIPVELSVAALHDGEAYVVNAFLHDITERKRAERQLRESENRVWAIADNVPVLISYMDDQTRVKYVNATFHAWTGRAAAEVIGKPLEQVISRGLYEQCRPGLLAALRGERVEFEGVSSAGGVERHMHNVYVPDLSADGRVRGVYALTTDVTGSKQVEAQLQALARIDTLTGLPNRRAFEERVEAALARSGRTCRPMALMFMDVDHFKEINDRLGHGVGDEVLKEFAARVLRCVRSTDTVARLAGDEFVIILENLGAASEAALVARKIGLALRGPFLLDSHRLAVTSSVGVAVVDGDDVTPADLVNKADEALYAAKRAGRNTYELLSFVGARQR
ncbi:PAS domain S-box protein [Caldimonas brevitalea]|uniref:Diguanylate cyclase/phosphodiesterase n=1 Tax=Caldimonas brevitalea TaxID=413882 RepID=A0A0G3BKS8_9BURK|nr:PAS domain S-box protein [Caldimonas brevitalea]AKJ27145.1 diguanylate cyclase/phosphodiesterase [Caldimonas brevitalea]